MRRAVAVLVSGGLAAAVASGCGGTSPQGVDGASASRGHDLISYYGCGSCHTISGVSGADGQVGPPLTGFASRRYIVGRLANTPQNVARWVAHPQRFLPGTIMPDLGVTFRQGLDIAAYLDGQ